MVLYLEFSPIQNLKKKKKTPRVHTKEQETFCNILGGSQAQPLWIAHMFLWCIIKFFYPLFCGGSISFSQSSLWQQLIWGSWALDALNFVARFLSNNCSFLLEATSVKSYGLLLSKPT